MEEISIEVDGMKYIGMLKITGVRKLRFTVSYDGREKTDAKDYRKDQIGYLKSVAQHILWEMVSGRL